MILLSACGGRTPFPVTVKRSYDLGLTCPEIATEYAENRYDIELIFEEDNLRHQRNAALMVVTALGGNLGNLAFIDRGEGLDVELEALVERNLTLTSLNEEKDCDPLFPPMDDIVAKIEAEKASRAAALAAQEEARKQAEEQR